MTKFPVIYSDTFLLHDTGFYHPECAGRLQAITAALKSVPWADQIEWRSPTPVETRSQAPEQFFQPLYAVHPQGYVEAVRNLSNRGGGHIDPDTVISPRSYDAAMLAISAWLDGVDLALSNNSPAFALVRPPGHHAMRDRGMGFCLFSSAAIAAHYALLQPSVSRVAILDWDVHHGNGTEAIVEAHPQIAYCSLHQSPFYPGTGSAQHRGKHDNVLNLPLPQGSHLSDYQPLFDQNVVPFLRQFQPDILLISAGYDATSDDPLAGISLQPQDFNVFTGYCLAITNRLVFGLEGGYDFSSLAQSVVATIERCVAG